jgi:signal transduction histidine kinase
MRELKQSQKLLCRVEKFSFLGNLAARLAHEIKNPMTAIGTFLQMLPHRYEDEEFRNEFQSIALEETRRVNRLITELLDLVNKRESRFESTDIHSLINKMTLLISPQSKSKRLTIQKTFTAEDATARVDTEKVKQVILNLLSNAVESTPEQGSIQIETSRVEIRKEAYLQVVISDSGPGIPEEIADKIFDPYFTTKHKSTMHNGTGLGLFIAHQHMLDHGGTIEMDTSCTQGASFILKFPLQYNGSRHLLLEDVGHGDERI